MKVSKLVQNRDEAIRNIHSFQGELERSQELQSRLAYCRAWYAIRQDDGTYLFGPSKFIGYSGMTAEEYVGPNNDRDGRRTESRLQDWFEEVTNPRAARLLESKLADYLAKFGKAPSKKARINVCRQPANIGAGADSDELLLNLLVAVLRRLSPEQRHWVRNRI